MINILNKRKFQVGRSAEVSVDEHDNLDEVLIKNLKCFHLENMSKKHWWIGITAENGDYFHINLWEKEGEIIASISDESGIS